MTIQKVQISFGNKTYDVILEDGIVFYIDPAEPLLTKELGYTPGTKVTSLEDAKHLVLQHLAKHSRQL